MGTIGTTASFVGIYLDPLNFKGRQSQSLKSGWCGILAKGVHPLTIFSMIFTLGFSCILHTLKFTEIVHYFM
jgi:hypothetical protein